MLQSIGDRELVSVKRKGWNMKRFRGGLLSAALLFAGAAGGEQAGNGQGGNYYDADFEDKSDK